MISDASIIAIIAAIPSTIAAIGAFVVSMRNGVKADITIQKANDIHTLADGNLTKVSDQLTESHAQMEGLHTKLETALGQLPPKDTQL